MAHIKINFIRSLGNEAKRFPGIWNVMNVGLEAAKYERQARIFHNSDTQKCINCKLDKSKRSKRILKEHYSVSRYVQEYNQGLIGTSDKEHRNRNTLLCFYILLV